MLLDAFSRRVIGWALAEHLRDDLAIEALDMALATREVISGGLVHHSDRGVQYASGDYVDRLEARGIVISMSRIACPYDNAMAESFMKTLKTEEVEGRPYRDLAQAKSDIASFIEEVYNRTRLHSALAYPLARGVRKNRRACLGCCAAAQAGAHSLSLIARLTSGVQSRITH